MASAANWLKKNIISKYIMKDCPEEAKCLKVLEVILDDETTPEEREIYFTHIDGCWSCYQNHNLEKDIRELIKSKIENRQVPKDLILKIQEEIGRSAAP